MDMNATIIGQMITFILFVAFTMKFVWPPFMKVLNERRQKILDGLAAADKGQHELEKANLKVQELLQQARSQASMIVDEAHHRAQVIENEARAQANQTIEKMQQAAAHELDESRQQLLHDLRLDFANIAVAATEKLLRRHLDQSTDHALIEEFTAKLK